MTSSQHGEHVRGRARRTRWRRLHTVATRGEHVRTIYVHVRTTWRHVSSRTHAPFPPPAAASASTNAACRAALGKQVSKNVHGTKSVCNDKGARKARSSLKWRVYVLLMILYANGWKKHNVKAQLGVRGRGAEFWHLAFWFELRHLWVPLLALAENPPEMLHWITGGTEDGTDAIENTNSVSTTRLYSALSCFNSTALSYTCHVFTRNRSVLSATHACTHLSTSARNALLLPSYRASPHLCRYSLPVPLIWPRGSSSPSTWGRGQRSPKKGGHWKNFVGRMYKYMQFWNKTDI